MHGILPYRGHTKALSELYMREASTAPQQHSNWVRTDQCGTRRFRIARVPDWLGKAWYLMLRVPVVCGGEFFQKFSAATAGRVRCRQSQG